MEGMESRPSRGWFRCRESIGIPGGDDLVKSLVQTEEQVDLSPFIGSKGRDLGGIEPGGDSMAEVVDAEHVPGEESASLLSQEKAASAVEPFGRNLDAQQQVDEQQEIRVVILQACTAAGTPVLFAIPAGLQDT